ncbi:3-hydroxyacyl-ACP dehydratase FabZ family protein [Nonomuraea sp. SBT364]|uniref:3-hydroxyacyl-ACP dehydratase FabZ family protein n=1 Tax=Nonomuraea sp. SBT364 TaxID=1580530 RepID=UPI00066C28B8|nr:3-hydroxyacyl-ACP dehydratase [Nonomuraea sp. SBT364]
MIGIDGIKKIIPHRFPILLLDRVLDVSPGESLVAVKAVTGTEPCYERIGDQEGPGAYHYPWPLLLESWAQAAALLALWESPTPDVLTGDVVLAGGMRNVRFHHPVLPGQVIEHRVRMVRKVGENAIMEGESLVGPVVVQEMGTMIETTRPIGVLA